MIRFLFALALGIDAMGSSPATWELSQFGDFIKGKLKNVSITRDGALIPGPSIEAALATPDSAIWSIAAGPDGTVYAGTGPRGRIYRRVPGSTSLQLFGTLPEPHVFALAVDPKGVLYAAGSPGGAVYLVSENEVKLFAKTPAKFIWSLAATSDAVFAGGGDDGRVYRLANGGFEVFYETGQSNVTALAIATDGSVLAGADPNGIVYRIAAKGSAQILYDSPYTEIRTILASKSGAVYFLGMGGAAAKRAQTANQPATGAPATGIPQVTTTITVTEEAQAGIDLKPKTQAAQSTATVAGVTPAVTSTLDVPGLDRSSIFRLNTDLTVDTLFVTKEESIYDLAERDGKIHFSSDNHGRIYRLDGDRQATLVTETGEAEIGRIFPAANAWIAAATTSAKLLVLSAQPPALSEYESPVHEAANIARWGALNASVTGEVAFETRSGNSMKPDATWSSWQALAAARIQSPNARNIQWRFRAAKAFHLRSVTLNYLPQNLPPSVKSITAALSVVAANSPRASAATSTSSVYTLTVTDTGESSSSTSAGTASLLPTRPVTRQLLLSWVAEDPDGDQMQYALHFRGEDESQWKPLKTELTDANFTIDADTLADGRYLFRVIANDSLSNTQSSAKSGELSSVPVQVDQTPPTITLTQQDNRLAIQCADSASPIRRIEYSINAGRWQILDAADGVYDSKDESAIATLTLPAGESIVTVRAYDASLNVSLRKLVLRR